LQQLKPKKMKKRILIGLFIAGFFQALQSQTLKRDSIFMGAGYVNQIFYDMANGQIKSDKVYSWDIAHTTDARSSCIRANHMTGLRVYAYPKNTNTGWASFDTAGWKKWYARYNNIHEHDKGAFSLVANHPKYDWGSYDALSHEIVGDSIYLLAWTNGATWVKFLKFWPIKQPTSTDLIFKYANVDGSNEITDTLYQSAANAQNYKYYTFAGKAKNVREPDKATWDITFNRYYEPQYDPTSGTVIPYPTMGVETNRNLTKVARLIGPSFATTLADSADLARKNYQSKYTNDLTAIGSNWKIFNNGFILKDTQSYIVKAVLPDSVYWLIHFTDFGGNATGKVVFDKLKLRSNNVSIKQEQLGVFNIFPNPANGQLFISLENSKVSKAIVEVTDLTGKMIVNQNIQVIPDFGAYELPIKNLKSGIYLVSVKSGDNILTQKLVVD